MLVEKDIKQILSHLAIGNAINVPFDGSDIQVCVIDDASKLSLSALVYEGGNYIPSSVRGCLSRKSPFFHPSMKTSLTIDENNFQIRLNFLSPSYSLTQEELKSTIEEFGVIAHEWRIYLDDHDKNDLVYVRVKS